MNSSIRISVAMLAFATLMGGCAEPTKPLYDWRGFQAELYTRLKSPVADPQAAIVAMQLDLEKIRASGGTPPPGFQAHLGYLQLAAGDADKAFASFQAESAAFPEFEPYRQFLIARSKK